MVFNFIPVLLNRVIGRSFTTTSFRASTEEDSRLSGKTHPVNNFERKMLVWTGKYKTVGEVPSYISPEVMERARSRIRIRVANVMMALTAVGCVVMVYVGKQARKRGETVHQQNLDWHKQHEDSVIKDK